MMLLLLNVKSKTTLVIAIHSQILFSVIISSMKLFIFVNLLDMKVQSFAYHGLPTDPMWFLSLMIVGELFSSVR